MSESLLIGSAEDGRAAVIEKSPGQTALFAPDGNLLVCTNHFQSAAFATDKYNVENIATSDSPWRYCRLDELISTAGTINPHTAAAILCDNLGVGGTPLPPGDPRSVNQPLAHHSVIFQPARQLMWVSVGMGHGGDYVCYDLGKIFAAPDFSTELRTPSLTIPANH